LDLLCFFLRLRSSDDDELELDELELELELPDDGSDAMGRQVELRHAHCSTRAAFSAGDRDGGLVRQSDA
jgi:hypothetical protein